MGGRRNAADLAPYPCPLDDEDRSPGEGDHGKTHRSAPPSRCGRGFCYYAAVARSPWRDALNVVLLPELVEALRKAEEEARKAELLE